MKQSKAAKRAGKDNIPNDFWKRLEGRGLGFAETALSWQAQATTLSFGPR